MIRKSINRFTSLFAWLNRNQIVAVNGCPVKVNLGSGLTVAPGWINLDGSLNAFVSRWPTSILKRLYIYSDCRQWYSKDDYIRILKSNRFVHHYLQYGFPFRGDTVDYAYSSHVLEHLFIEEAETLLRNVYRALKKGGRLRVAVPDLAIVVTLYQTGRKRKALEYFFTQTRSGVMNCHRYMYDFELLSDLLQYAGFGEVTRCSFRTGEVPDIDYLDNRPEETLYVEAVKS